MNWWPAILTGAGVWPIFITGICTIIFIVGTLIFHDHMIRKWEWIFFGFGMLCFLSFLVLLTNQFTNYIVESLKQIIENMPK